MASGEILTQEEIDALLQQLEVTDEDETSLVADVDDAGTDELLALAQIIVGGAQGVFQAAAGIVVRLGEPRFSLTTGSGLASALAPGPAVSVQAGDAWAAGFYICLDHDAAVAAMGEGGEWDQAAVDRWQNLWQETMAVAYSSLSNAPGASALTLVAGAVAETSAAADGWFESEEDIARVSFSWQANGATGTLTLCGPWAELQAGTRLLPTLAEPPAAPTPAKGSSPLPQIQSMPLPQLTTTTKPGSDRIDLLADIPLELSVELGRTRRRLAEVLTLGPGSLLELDRLAGEAVDVRVNGRLVARGEVVVIGENFGVRVTDIVSPAARLEPTHK